MSGRPDALRLTLASLPPGDAGTFATADAMRKVANENATDPVVRRVAIHITRGGPPRDLPRQIAAIRSFLTRRVNFIDDPQTAELVQDPAWLLLDIEREGVTYGDCDDVATLGAALGQAIGIPARFVLAAFGESDAPFSHVWAELYDGESWRELDTTRPAQDLGPFISRRAIIDLSTGRREAMDTMQGYAMGRRPKQGGGGVGFAVVPAVMAGISLAQKMGPLLTSGRAADRIAAIDRAYTEAINGSEPALLFLKQRTGDYGVITIPGMPGEYGGYATAEAKAYARQRYDDALRVLGTVTIPGTNVTIPGGVAQAGLSITTLAIGAAVVFFLVKGRR